MEDEEEYEYFTADRLVGVITSFTEFDGTEVFEVVELIHLTSRFGAFRREGLRWESIWQGWNPDPDFVYVNFKPDAYDKVMRAFDESKNFGMDYSEVKEFREVRSWEGSFDLTEPPHFFRPIDEVINQIQDFVEPRPEIITYGRGRVRCGDMAWMHPFVSDLQEQRENLENFILDQKRKPYLTKLEEPLTRIEMYPPLHDEAITLFTAAANQVPDLDDFDEQFQSTVFMNYFRGGRISMNQLKTYCSEFLTIAIANDSVLTKQEADSFRLSRDAHLRPAHRLEAWFFESDDSFDQLIASTEFGLYQSAGRGKWRPLIRDYEIEDVYDFKGVYRIHIRPESEHRALSHSVQGGFDGKTAKDRDFVRYQVSYRGEETTFKDFYDRTPQKRDPKISFKSLKRIAATVVTEMIYELRADVKVLLDEGLSIDETLREQAILEEFLRNKVELSYRELHELLNSCFYSNAEEGNGIQQMAQDIRKKNESRNKFEKLMERRDVEYLPLSSMVLVVAYQPSVTMWLEYRSHYYGRFARRSGTWQTNIQQNPDIFKELILYEVKEERVPELVNTFDDISRGGGSASFAELAPMLCILRMNKNADVAAINNDDWDARPFVRQQMQPSTAVVFEALYSQIQQHFEDRADSYLELSQDQLAQALLADREELTSIYGDEVRKFVRKGATLDRKHLSGFMSGALEILSRSQ